MRRALAVVCLAGLLAACSPLLGKSAIDSDKLDDVLDNRLGGAGTCVVLTDVKTGLIAYQYGAKDVCGAPLPPCATFDVPAALIGLDAGVVTPASVYKWDGSAQPVGAWQTDADMSRAFNDQIGWWWGRLGQAIGHDRFAEALNRFGYGNRRVDGPERAFWMGPSGGGTLALSTRQQAGFFRRLYHGDLGLKPETSRLVQALLVDEVRNDSKLGRAVISATDASCPIVADGSRNVSWSVGRLATPTRDLAFAASVVGQAPPPGIEVRQKIKDSFADAGLWPAG